MAPFVRSLLLALVLSSATAAADVAPEPAKGERFLTRSVVVDASGLAPDCALVVASGFGNSVSLVNGPLPVGKFGQWFYCAPKDRADALRVQDLEALGRKPTRLMPWPLEQVPLSSPRQRVERHVKVSGGPVLTLQVEEDLLLDGNGSVLCRRPRLNQEIMDNGQDPCDPDARSKRIQYFMQVHRLALAGGSGLALIVLLGAAVGLRARRQRAARG